jgi:hypothetical protein
VYVAAMMGASKQPEASKARQFPCRGGISDESKGLEPVTPGLTDLNRASLLELAWNKAHQQISQPVPHQNYPSVSNAARINHVSRRKHGSRLKRLRSPYFHLSESQSARRCGKRFSSQSRSSL